MTHGISVVHRLGTQTFESKAKSKDKSKSNEYSVFGTCMRQIALGPSGSWVQDIAEANDQVFQNETAYQFILEVICGLHSPVVGETEVFGQFKNFVKATQSLALGELLAPLFQSLFADAKIVREKYLVGLGAQSYGSLVRKHTKECQHVAIVGAGQLAEEVIPWLVKAQRHVVVFARNMEKAERLKKLGPVKVFNFKDHAAQVLPQQHAVVIAAPMPAERIEQVLGGTGNAGKAEPQILDLRGESRTDPIQLKNVLNLQELFAELSVNASQLVNRTNQARTAIEQAAKERFHQHAKLRPFGWDDLCA